MAKILFTTDVQGLAVAVNSLTFSGWATSNRMSDEWIVRATIDASHTEGCIDAGIYILPRNPFKAPSEGIIVGIQSAEGPGILKTGATNARGYVWFRGLESGSYRVRWVGEASTAGADSEILSNAKTDAVREEEAATTTLPSIDVTPNPEIETTYGFKYRPFWIAAGAVAALLIAVTVILNDRPSEKRNPIAEAASKYGTPDIAPLIAMLQTSVINTASGQQVMGAENPERDREYRGQSLIVHYFDHTKTEYPFTSLPIHFQAGSSKLVDDGSLATMSHLAIFLKALKGTDLKLWIEVHARGTDDSNADKQLSNERVQVLQSWLEEHGTPHSLLAVGRGYGAKFFQEIKPGESGSASTDGIVLLIREK